MVNFSWSGRHGEEVQVALLQLQVSLTKNHTEASPGAWLEQL